MSYAYVEDHRDYLLREFKNRVQRRPLYSQRALARDMSLSPSTLNDYLRDRLALSAGRISQISKKIGLNDEQRDHWVDLVTYRFSNSPEKKKVCQVKIKSRVQTEKNAMTAEEFKLISEWQHFAFLELLDMNAKKYSNLKTSAKALSLNLAEMKATADRLTNLKLIHIQGKGLLSVSDNTYIGNAAPSEAIRFFHSQILNKAQGALETQTITERFNSSTLVGLPLSKIPQIIEHLKSVGTQILEPHLKTDIGEEKDQLYCLSLQFFGLLEKKR